MRTWQKPPSYEPRRWTPPFQQPASPPSSNVAPVSAVPPKPSLNNIERRRYSKIMPAEFVRHKLIPKPEMPVADVDYMDWYFDEPVDDDDHEVRVYVTLTEEDVAYIKRRGLHHDVFETIKLFEPADMERLEAAQQQELATASDPHTRAQLEIEHKHQREWAEEQQVEITIVDFLASPYRKQFENRLKATLGERDINRKLADFKKKLPHYNER